ncbi:hypothetical protein NSK_008321, partial [Nannochloropsis salina CCMP1776]
ALSRDWNQGYDGLLMDVVNSLVLKEGGKEGGAEAGGEERSRPVNASLTIFTSHPSIIITLSSALAATSLLSEFGVEEESTIQLLMDINGGMRAKWRKKRMRRLRRKRRKMRMRAR